MPLPTNTHVATGLSHPFQFTVNTNKFKRETEREREKTKGCEGSKFYFLLYFLSFKPFQRMCNENVPRDGSFSHSRPTLLFSYFYYRLLLLLRVLLFVFFEGGCTVAVLRPL